MLKGWVHQLIAFEVNLRWSFIFSYPSSSRSREKVGSVGKRKSWDRQILKWFQRSPPMGTSQAITLIYFIPSLGYLCGIGGFKKGTFSWDDFSQRFEI